MPVGLLLVTACGGDSIEQTCGDDQESGIACTWLGMAGVEGFNGDGNHRLATELYWTMDMVFLPDGSAVFDDWNNHLVRKVHPDGTVTSLVGWTDPTFPGDGIPGDPGQSIERTEAGAEGSQVRLNHPTNLVYKDDGYVYLMAWHNHKLRRIDPETGQVWIVAGAGAGYRGDGGSFETALFKQPQGLELYEGDFYISDQQNFRVRKIDGDTGMMEAVAGNGMQMSGGDGGPALEASLFWEAGSNPEPSGGLVLHEGMMYIADTEAHRVRVVDMDTWTIETLAGTGEKGFSGDGGPAVDAQLFEPRDLEIGPEGDLYIADTNNHRIRAIDLDSGEIRTVAGTDEYGLGPEGLPATETSLWRPFGIDFDQDGNLYISDTINSRVVRVMR